jgi:hypothetical protein
LKTTNCKICGHSSSLVFNNKIIGKYQVDFFQCQNCGFGQTEDPYWLDEAYNESMNLGDTGQMVRNLNARNVLLALVFFLFDKSKKYLDYAGGYGMFTRLMRDSGVDFFWNDKYTKNLISKGFEIEMEEQNFELISTFECFEHLVNPLEEITELFLHTDNVFFTTLLISKPAPDSSWWYYGLDHGQHVAFHSRGSMEEICKKLGLNFYSKRGYHLLTRRKINPLIYKLIVELAYRGLFFWVSNYFKSKTYEDHLLLTKVNADRKNKGL